MPIVALQMYDPQLVHVGFEREQKASIKFAGRTVQVREFIYSAEDKNFDRLNKWIFSIRVPKSSRGDIVLQPIQAPSKKVWAGIERRAIVFVEPSKQKFSSMRYCKVNLADPTGGKNKVGVRWDDRLSLPEWFEYFKSKMRVKEAITTTEGMDGRALAVLVKPNDHKQMIRLYFAFKVWVLEKGFVLSR